MKTQWLFILSAMVTVMGSAAKPTAEDITGVRLQRRIVGGQEAAANEFPWQVSLRYDGNHMCGGSILDEKTIITVARCVELFFNADPEKLRIVAGELSISRDDGTEQVRKIKEKRSHGKYSASLSLENDISLLILEEPLELNESVAPIALPSVAAEPSEGDKLVASGWGSMQTVSDPLSDVLRWVAIPYISDDACNEVLFNQIGQITPNMMCAGDLQLGGVDICNGDFGGPLTTEDRSTLVGLTSWGNGCGEPGHPGVYTQVSHYVGWIEENRA